MTHLQTIVEESNELTRRIEALPASARLALAVGSAAHLMRSYRARHGKYNPFVLEWERSIEPLWQVLSGREAAVSETLRDQLSQFYAGPYWEGLEGEALPGADENAAAATIHAVEAYCNGRATDAVYAVRRLIEDAREVADLETIAAGDNLMSEAADARSRGAAQAALGLLGDALRVVEQEGVTNSSIEKLRSLFVVD